MTRHHIMEKRTEIFLTIETKNGTHTSVVL